VCVYVCLCVWCVCMYVCLCVCLRACVCPVIRIEQLDFHRTDIHEIWYLSIFFLILEKTQVSV